MSVRDITTTIITDTTVTVTDGRSRNPAQSGYASQRTQSMMIRTSTQYIRKASDECTLVYRSV
jgi:hypothetical protein